QRTGKSRARHENHRAEEEGARGGHLVEDHRSADRGLPAGRRRHREGQVRRQRPAEPGRAEAHLPGPEADQLTSPPSRPHPPYSRIRRSLSGPGLGVLGQRVQAALDVATPFFPGAARAIIDMWIEKYVVTV